MIHSPGHLHHETSISFNRFFSPHISRLCLYWRTNINELCTQLLCTREAHTAYSCGPSDHRAIGLNLLLLCPRTRTQQDVQWQYYQSNHFCTNQQGSHGAREETVNLLGLLDWDEYWFALVFSHQGQGPNAISDDVHITEEEYERKSMVNVERWVSAHIIPVRINMTFL